MGSGRTGAGCRFIGGKRETSHFQVTGTETVPELEVSTGDNLCALAHTPGRPRYPGFLRQVEAAHGAGRGGELVSFESHPLEHGDEKIR